MATPDSSKSVEGSPGYHPMILRSSCCRLCYGATPSDGHLTVPSGTIHHRNVHEGHCNLNFQNHQHHHEDTSGKRFIAQDAGYVTEHISQSVAKESSSTAQKDAVTSENTAFMLSDSQQNPSLVKQLTSSPNFAAVTQREVHSNSIKYSSSSMYKEVHSDYSSGDENEFFCGGEVNTLSFEEDMSRTRAHTRMPLSSVRFGAIPDSGRYNENLRAKSTHLVNSSSIDDVGLTGIFHVINGGKKARKNVTRSSNHLYYAAGSSDNMSHSDESHMEESFMSSTPASQQSNSHSGSVVGMFSWLFWRCIYLSTCDVLLFDTWILSRCNTLGKKKILLILLFLLIPLWFLGVFQPEAYSGDLRNRLGVLKSNTSLFSFSFLGKWFTREHQDYDSLPVCNNSGAARSFWPDMWNIFSVKKVDSVKTAVPPVSAKSDLEISVPGAVELSDEKIRLLALEVFKKESSLLVEQLEKKNKQADVEQTNLKVVQNEISLVNSQYQSLSDSLQALKSEIKEQLQSDTANNKQSHPQLFLLNSKLHNLEEKLQSFETILASAKNCCRNQSDYLLAESHLTSLLIKVMEGHEDENYPILYAFQSWLRSTFISHKNLSDEVVSVIERMYGNSVKFSQQQYEDIAKRVAESVVSKSMKSLEHDLMNISKSTSSSVSADYYSQGSFKVDDIQKIVKEAILLYDADKTGRVDYALESGGGSIVSTRCSDTYNAGTARLSIFGLPLWYTSMSPRTAIQPDVQPGECWAFHGSQGFLVIQLSATILPTGFSMEHIPKSLSPTGTIDSAPKEFSVWGLVSEKNDAGKLLGEFIYESDGDPLQYFSVESDMKDYYSVIELKIHSNWGNQKYTCLYRFRVHGTPL